MVHLYLKKKKKWFTWPLAWQNWSSFLMTFNLSSHPKSETKDVSVNGGNQIETLQEWQLRIPIIKIHSFLDTLEILSFNFSSAGYLRNAENILHLYFRRIEALIRVQNFVCWSRRKTPFFYKYFNLYWFARMEKKSVLRVCERRWQFNNLLGNRKSSKKNERMLPSDAFYLRRKNKCACQNYCKKKKKKIIRIKTKICEQWNRATWNLRRKIFQKFYKLLVSLWRLHVLFTFSNMIIIILLIYFFQIWFSLNFFSFIFWIWQHFLM